mmetsp:Transcript_4670/g.8200  ORF Transcript_4670/g.8200 Transcript_4670/m.8200 type:complete len:243 (-) Transcript_4670:271-999(-)
MLVILLPQLRVAQHLVGLPKHLEPLVRVRVVLVLIRVVNPSQVIVSSLDLLLSRFLPHSKNLVVVGLPLLPLTKVTGSGGQVGLLRHVQARPLVHSLVTINVPNDKRRSWLRHPLSRLIVPLLPLCCALYRLGSIHTAPRHLDTAHAGPGNWQANGSYRPHENAFDEAETTAARSEPLTPRLLLRRRRRRRRVVVGPILRLSRLLRRVFLLQLLFERVRLGHGAVDRDSYDRDAPRQHSFPK